MSLRSSRLLSDKLWPELRELDRAGKPVIAAFAYFSHDHLHLRRGDVLVVDASTANVRFGSVKARLLKNLAGRGVIIHNHPGLHAKVISIGAHVVVGSANCSINSERRLTEAAVITSDPVIKSQVLRWLEALQKSPRLSPGDIKKLLGIKPVPRKFHPSTSPLVFDAEVPKQWWLGIGPLSDQIERREEQDAKDGYEEAVRQSGVPDDELTSIRWEASAAIAQRLRVGDTVFQAFSTPRGNSKNTRVLGPAVIVHIQRKDHWVRLYLEYLFGYRESVTLNQALKALDRLNRRVLSPSSARSLYDDEVAKLFDLLRATK